MKVYVHSDDLGATKKISMEMMRAWQEGALDGFSILANGEASSYVKTRLAAVGLPARIGVHLNLTEGPCSAKPEKVPLLVNAKGLLRHSFGSLLKVWIFGDAEFRQHLIAQIEIEWKAQIKQVKSLCGRRRLTQLDGHIHIHMLPFLFPLAARLAREHKIESIRVSREHFYLPRKKSLLFTGYFWVNVIKYVVLRHLSNHARPFADREGLDYSEAMVGVLHTGHMTSDLAEGGVLTAINKTEITSVEVLFHAGRAREAKESRAFREVLGGTEGPSPRRQKRR